MTQTLTKQRQRTIELANELGYVYREYAHYTLLDRAIADVRDGFKPVHRRIVYAMGDMGLGSDAQHRKSARVVGEVLGKYHPHGDQSVYDALARMAQDFSQREILIDGQGNFGSIDGDSPAAMRYTECRLSAVGNEMLRDIKMDTVDWQDNFDNSLQEPKVLPATFPNVLVNGSSGIAVGFAANLAPHNLGEVCDAVVMMCDRWKSRQEITVDDLMAFIPGPDFPTGGLVYRYRTDRRGSKTVRTDAIRKAYDKGKAGIICQARIKIEQSTGRAGDQIIVTEIPYGQKKSTIIQRIAREARDGKINGVTDIIDESDRDGMRVVIQLSRQASNEDVLDMLVRRSTLRATFGVNNLVLVPREGQEGRIVEPRRLSLKEILEYFVLHRLEIIQRRSQYELNRREARLHIVEGLLIALDQIDEVIDTIRRSRTADTARRNLMRKFKLTQKQATAILDMQLRRLAAMERSKLKKEKKELQARIKYLKKLLASEAKQLAVIKEETQEIKEKYATLRQTSIVDAAPGENGAAVTKADLATPENAQMVAVTTKGITRCDASSYSYRVKSGATSRAVTAHRMTVRAEPEDKVIFVTDQGRAWAAPVGFVPEEASPSKMGLNRGEKIIYLDLLDLDRSLLIGTAQGKIKRTAMADMEPDLPDGVWAEVIGLNKGDRAIFAGIGDEQAQVLMITGERLLRTEVSEVSDQKTLTARGVAGIKPGKHTEVLEGAVIQNPKSYEVVLLDGKGYMRRVPLKQFSTQGRGGKGLKIVKSSRSVAVAAVGEITKSTKVDVLAEDGKRQRIPVKSIPRARTRQSRGKKLVAVGTVSEIVIL